MIFFDIYLKVNCEDCQNNYCQGIPPILKRLAKSGILTKQWANKIQIWYMLFNNKDNDNWSGV
jgi:hypothetical protein